MVALRPFVVELARRLKAYAPDLVVGPATGGAILAQVVAAELGKAALSAERIVVPDATGLFPVRYEVARESRDALRGKRVAIVDDAISAGSAVRGTLHDVIVAGATPIALGALLIFGEAAEPMAKKGGLPLVAVARRGLGMWRPEECPLCRVGQPTESVG
jgi:orotate phosphoribosyltransferase